MTAAEPWWNLDVIGTRVRLAGMFGQERYEGRLLSYVVGQNVACRLERDDGVIYSVPQVTAAEFPPVCGAMYAGDSWQSMRCEHAPGHDPEDYHCDRFGRTW